ncbi:MAG: Hpt domain-containing protein [Hyphomicrobiaceae bacterium]|nr:Hpt domain-containing protein [Hyphomicrobiaceae bacterium]
MKGFRNEIERSQIELRTADTPTAIERVCHRLIGVSAPIGLRDLAAKAREAQRLARERSSHPAQAVPLAELEDAMSVAIEALDDVLA